MIPRAAALVLWAVAMVQSTALLAIVSRPDVPRPPSDFPDPFYVVGALALAGVGSFVAAARPRNAVGWLLALCGVFAGAEALAAAAAASADPASTTLAWLAQWLWVPAVACMTTAMALFPDGAAASPRWRLAVGVLAIAAVGVAAVAALSPNAGSFRPRGLGTGPGPLVATGPLGSLLDAAFPVVPLWVLSSLALVLVALVVRYRRGDDVARARLKWLIYAAGLMLATFALGPLSTAVLGGAPSIGLGLTAIALAMGIAILRHGLFDIDLLISRTLAYAALSGTVIALYLAAAGYLGTVLRRPDDPLVSAAAALVVAALFHPLRSRVQRAVDRLVYGQRSEPYAVVAELGRRLEAALDSDAVLPAVAATVAQALRLPYVAIELEAEDGTHIAAAHGHVGEPAVSLPLLSQGETIGRLLVAARPGEARLGDADLRLLEGLARQVGLAAHGVRATAELRRARERIVLAREEERRRLLRDLHDELGPRLASHTLLVDAARAAVPRDRDRADALLAELADETRRSVEEVRRIARGLRPTALDELGLARALRDVAERCASSTLAVEVHVAELPSTPTAVETAVYQVASEALTNVVRHASARHCAVRLHRDGDERLVLEVEDDGVGIRPEAPPGMGLASMRERVHELGGACHVAARPGRGTRVIAHFPVAGGAA